MTLPIDTSFFGLDSFNRAAPIDLDAPENQNVSSNIDPKMVLKRQGFKVKELPQENKPEPKATAKGEKKAVWNPGLIGMNFLGEKPKEPAISVVFEYEFGKWEKFVHSIVESPGALYLIDDTRYKTQERFIPKSNDRPVKITANGKQYNGLLWEEGVFRVGCLRISPVLLTSESAEDIQKTEENISDY